MSRKIECPKCGTRNKPGTVCECEPKLKVIPKPGDVIEFKGCTFDDGWNFGCPAVIYSPVNRYGDDNLYALVEGACIDLCLNGETRSEFHDTDITEFKWRRWSPKGFSKRKAARHRLFRAKFYIKKYDLTFNIEEVKK